jgi:hypothetical protein
MKKNSRTLTLSEAWSDSCRTSFPLVRLKGFWLNDFGFHVGDKVTVTSPEPHTLIIRVTKSAEEFRQEKLAAIEEQFKNHKSPVKITTHPYESATTNPEKSARLSEK